MQVFPIGLLGELAFCEVQQRFLRFDFADASHVAISIENPSATERFPDSGVVD